jgi:cytidylate kinase
MTIITISRGPCSKGREIAEKAAEMLKYECMSREVLLEVSEHFNQPENKILKALHDAPSVLDRFTHGKERYIAYIKEAILKHIKKDNIVYHGLAGHFFVKGVGHGLKVRIIADFEDRVLEEMEREKISKSKAESRLKKDDEERSKWSAALYGVDTAEPSLYDLVIHLQTITVEEAVSIICHTAKLSRFQTTPESKQTLDDLALAAEAGAALINGWPDAVVTAIRGEIVIEVDAPRIQESSVRQKITSQVERLQGVNKVTVEVRPSNLFTVD